MKFEGQRIKQTRWVHADSCAVRLQVEAVIPVGDPSEPCFEPNTVEFLRKVHERAQAGDIDWLKGVGDVYVRLAG